MDVGAKSRSLAKQNKNRLPQAGTVIASSFTSPIDCLYLAAIFDPIFTASYPGTRQVRQISLAHAILRALLPVESIPPPPTVRLVDLSDLLKANPSACVVVQPECVTTNGRGILRFSPSLLSAPATAKIFPVSLRYTPGDVTTPIPGEYVAFLWNLCSRPTHCIRVRFAECTYNTTAKRTFGHGNGNNIVKGTNGKNPYDANIFDVLDVRDLSVDKVGNSADGMNAEELKVLERVGEALARLGRVKRVTLGVEDKVAFVKVWRRKRQ